jgi:hypothetical protein
VSQESYREQRDRKLAERAKVQEALPTMRVESDTRVHSDTTDDRRAKRYTRDVTVGVRVLVRDWEVREDLDRNFRNVGEGWTTPLTYVKQAVCAAFDGAPWPTKVTIECGGFGTPYGEAADEGWDFYVTYYIDAKFRAAKPSKILSEDECLARLGGADNIGARIREGIYAGLTKAKETKAAVERSRIASLILSDYAERVEERALKATRYTQRLAALEAEFKAELEAQTAALLSELGDSCGVTWDDAPDFVPDERSTKAAKAKLPERIARTSAPHKRGFMLGDSRSDKYAISVEEVE